MEVAPLAAFDPTKPTIDQTRSNAIDSIRNNFANLPASSGPPGPTGATGATGAPGAQGPQGATGPPGAGVPAGASTDVQINYQGAFYGDGNFTFNPTTGQVGIGYDLSVARYLNSNWHKQLSLFNISGGAGAINVDFNNAQCQLLTMTGNVTLTLTNMPVPSIFRLYVASTNAGTITWPANVWWPNGVAPNLAAGPNKYALVVIAALGGALLGNVSAY